MQEMNRHLAQRLKGLRAELGWSLDVAARETGVSKAMLGQIERGESSPTVATLWKIATGFRVSFSSFIEPTPAVTGETLYRIADDIRQQPAGEGMQVGHQAGHDLAQAFVRRGGQALQHGPGDVVRWRQVRCGHARLTPYGHRPPGTPRPR